MYKSKILFLLKLEGWALLSLLQLTMVAWGMPSNKKRRIITDDKCIFFKAVMETLQYE